MQIKCKVLDYNGYISEEFGVIYIQKATEKHTRKVPVWMRVDAH